MQKNPETFINYFNHDIIFFVLISICSFLLLFRNVNKPFWGLQEWNNNLWTTTARNNVKYGIFCTKLRQSTQGTIANSCNELGAYEDHPPLVSWLPTVSYSLFGFSEWAGRIPFIFISTGTALLIFYLGKLLFNRWTGLLASLLFITTPMYQYFGKSMFHESLAIFGILWALVSFWKWIKEDNTASYRLLLLCAVYTSLTEWHGYYIFGLLPLLTLIINRKLLIKSLVPLCILILMFFVNILRVRISTGGWNTDTLFNMLLLRMNLGTGTYQEIAARYSFLEYIIRLFRLAKAFFTPLLLIATVGLSVTTLTSIVKKKLSQEDTMLLALLFPAVCLFTIFSHLVSYHDFLVIYLLPFIALAASRFIILSTRSFPLAAKIIIVTTLPLYIFFSTKTFVSAFENSDEMSPYVTVAQQIQDNFTTDKKILIESGGFYDLVVPVYANYGYSHTISGRKDTATSFTKEKQLLEQAYDYLILIDKDPVEEDLVMILDQNYSKRETLLTPKINSYLSAPFTYITYNLHENPED